MRLIVLAMFVAISAVTLAAITRLPADPTTEFAVSTLGSILALVAPIVGYSFVSRRLTQRTVDTIGRSWCRDHNREFVRVEISKNHFSLIHADGSLKGRQRFRVRFRRLSWQVESVEFIR